MRVIITFSDKGYELGKRLYDRVPQAYMLIRCGASQLKPTVEQHFQSVDAFVFIGALGIAVRGIAPYIRSKTTDPAVVVIDELGRYVIPVISGHIGGANELALELANEISATPVITTATDINGVFAIDTWATKMGLHIVNPECIKHVSSKALKGGKITVYSEIDLELPNDLEETSNIGADVTITTKVDSVARRSWNFSVLKLVVPIYALGIGCKRGTSSKQIKLAVRHVLETNNVHPRAVYGIGSIDLKADEIGLLEFAKEWGIVPQFYSSEELASLKGNFSKSPFVAGVTGVSNVCERAAVLRCLKAIETLPHPSENPILPFLKPKHFAPEDASERLVVRKTSENGVTVALASLV